jgi:hypothetical protein
LGEKKLLERLPFICELAKAYVGVDPVKSRFRCNRTTPWAGSKPTSSVKPVSKGCLPWANVLLWSARRQPPGLQLPGGAGGLWSSGR